MTYHVKGNSLIAAAPEELPRPDLGQELRVAVVDALRGDRPRSVLGVLMKGGAEAISMGALAGYLERSMFEVEGIVDMLAEERLCVAVEENGIRKVLPAAGYTPKNDPFGESADA